MTTKALLCAAVSCSALVGCATLTTPPGTRAVCNSATCMVTVKVADCVIKVEPETLEVKGPNRELHWDIDREAAQAGYTFADVGVWIKDYDAKREFTDPRRLTPTKFKWHDKNSFPGIYKYGVRVMKGSATCPDLDPFIVNN
jgi:hypothetical protein